VRKCFSIPRLVCLCAAFLAIGAGTASADGFKVVAVEVRGASRVAPDAFASERSARTASSPTPIVAAITPAIGKRWKLP